MIKIENLQITQKNSEDIAVFNEEKERFIKEIRKNSDKIIEFERQIKEKNREIKEKIREINENNEGNMVKIYRIFDDLGLSVQRKNEESLEKFKEKGFFGNLELKTFLLDGFVQKKG